MAWVVIAAPNRPVLGQRAVIEKVEKAIPSWNILPTTAPLVTGSIPRTETGVFVDAASPPVNAGASRCSPDPHAARRYDEELIKPTGMGDQEPLQEGNLLLRGGGRRQPKVNHAAVWLTVDKDQL